VQSSTHSAVSAIGSITDRMQEVQQFTATITASVEQQNAATQVSTPSAESGEVLVESC
jgi:hypothetical protein